MCQGHEGKGKTMKLSQIGRDKTPQWTVLCYPGLAPGRGKGHEWKRTGENNEIKSIFELILLYWY